MKILLRTKLIVSFLAIVIITGLVATLVGMYLIGDRIMRQTQDKVRLDLNSAREIYQEESGNIKDVIRLTAVRFFVMNAILANDIEKLKVELEEIRERESLDILNLTDEHGRVLARSRNPTICGDSQADDEIINWVLSKREVLVSTQIISKAELEKEGEDLDEQARIELIPTPRARPMTDTEETSGMMIKAAAPLFDDAGNLIGVLYGGNLLNRNYEIVDKVKDIVYKGEKYKEKDIGTATIFQGDLRISTNVKRGDGTRAIGTRVSKEVYDQVIIKGMPWVGRAFVVNNWYITAYEPIKSITNKIIGILYVGILEEKYLDMKRHTTLIFLVITLAGMAIAFAVSYLLANSIIKPIRYLVFASKRLAKGDLESRVRLKTKDEIGELGETFNFMASSLKERDDKLKEYTQQQIMKSERLATLGRLSAGIAHEINNPLGGILIYSHLLLENLDPQDPARANMEKIVREATRCRDIVRGLLDFARQTEPKMELANINEILEKVLSLIGKQALFHNIKIIKQLHPILPNAMVDIAQMQQVFVNIAINAAEAMKEGGDLIIGTRLSHDNHFIEIEFTDTGCGIPKKDINKIFDPFFTTKEAGHGTGLGLSISYGIIERHNGNIDIKSAVGKGTTFTIRLPVSKEK